MTKSTEQNRGREILLSLFLLALVGTTYRVTVLMNWEHLGALWYEEGSDFLFSAYTKPFWSALFAPHGGYLTLFVRLYSLILVKIFGVVDNFPIYFKVGCSLVHCLCCGILLSNRFGYLGSFRVRLLLCWLLACLNIWDLNQTYNTGYSLSFLLLYFLSPGQNDERPFSWSLLVFFSVLILFAALGKPAAIAFVPAFTLCFLAFAFEGKKSHAIFCAIVLVTLLTQVFYTHAHHNSFDLSHWYPANFRALGVLKILWGNWVTVSGLGPIGILFQRQFLIKPFSQNALGVLSVIAILLNSLWVITFIHSWNRKSFLASFPFLLPLVFLLPSILIIMGGEYVAWGVLPDWVALIKTQPEVFLCRHTILTSLVATLGTLAAIHYWTSLWNRIYGERLVVGLLSLSLFFLLAFRWKNGAQFDPMESASQWKELRPLLSKKSFCIPIEGFPHFMMKQGCEILSTKRLTNRGTQRFEHNLMLSNPRWKLNAVVVVRWRTNELLKRGALNVVSSDHRFDEIEIAPLSPIGAKYQYFDLSTVSSRFAKNQLRVIDQQQLPWKSASIYYLGSRN